MWWVLILWGNCFLICGHHPIRTHLHSSVTQSYQNHYPSHFRVHDIHEVMHTSRLGTSSGMRINSPLSPSSGFLYVLPSWWFASLSSNIVRGDAAAALVEMFKMKDGSSTKPLCPPYLCGSAHGYKVLCSLKKEKRYFILINDKISFNASLFIQIETVCM